MIFNQVQGLGHLQVHKMLPTTLLIIDQCWEVDEDLRLFYNNLEKTVPGPLYWPKFSTAEEHSEFPISFHFSDLNMATLLMVYWSTVTMLWSGMSQLYSLVQNMQSHTTTPSDENDSEVQSNQCQLKPLEHRSDYYTTARNICQSVEYCMQDEMLGFGPSTVVPPLTILIETFRDDPNFGREITWIKETLRKAKDSGIRILDHV